jgi:peptide/nickel transport system substrate-binding protein
LKEIIAVQDDHRTRHLTRRAFLTGATAAALGLASACGSTGQPTPTTAAQPSAVKPAAQVPAAPTMVPPPVATAAPTQAPAAAAKPAGPKKGGTFTMAYTPGITEFNPVNLVTGHYAFQRALFNTLAHYDAQLNLQPELATKWDFSADGKSLTLKLREGVKYHTGREFTSADVKASWEFATGDDKTTMRSLFKTITQVETPDKYSVVMRFASINPSILDALDVLYMIDKEQIADRAKSASGTGPFKLDKFIPNDRAEFVANKDYWDAGKPYLDRYVIRTIPDVAAMAVNLESAAVDAVWQPSNIDLVRLGSQSGGKFIADMGAPGAAMFNLAINVKREPFTDKRVRQAMAWSIDRARFCRTTLQSLVEPTCLMWPKHSWAYFPDLEGKLGYNLDKARALLKEAGLEKGFDTEMTVSQKRYFGSLDLAQILQNDVKPLGVNIKISDIEAAQYDAQVVNKGDHNMTVITFGRLNRDPGTLVTSAKAFYVEKEGTWTHFESQAYEDLRVEMQSTLDREKRKVTARKLQELVLDECFTNSIAYQQRAWAYASYVKGFTYDMDNAPFVMEMWLDK